MRLFAIVSLGLISLISAKPAFPPSTTSLTSDVRALDSANVARRVRVNVANEYARSVAPLGADGRVVDTPEVAAARAAHATAHVNAKINLAKEAARSDDDVSESPKTNDSAVTALGAVVGPDGRVLDTPEVVAARAAHNVAHVNERINLANEAARSSNVFARIADGSLIPLVLSNGVVAALVSVGPEDRSLVTPEALASSQKLTNDALPVAGPAVAYGGLIY